MRRYLPLCCLALLYCMPALAETSDLNSLQQRLASARQGAAATAAPQELSDAEQALAALRQDKPGSPDYIFEQDRLEARLRQAELKGQDTENREYLHALQQQHDTYIREIQQLKARQDGLKDQIAQRHQSQAQRDELNAELERQRRARLDAETRLAHVAAEQQQIEASLNALLGQWAQVSEDDEGKHLRLSVSSVFGHKDTLSAQGQQQVRNLATLLKGMPDRRFVVRAFPGAGQSRANALAQALVFDGLPAQSVAVESAADLPPNQLEILVRSAPAAAPAASQP